MKTRHPMLLTLVVLALLLPAAAAFAADSEDPAKGKGEAAGESPATIEGEVVAVQQRTGNGGEEREITVRTRDQQEMKLQLGPAGEGAPEYRKGDQVRAQIQAGPAGQAGGGEGSYQVRTMTNMRTGQQESFGEDTALQKQTRQRKRDGTGDQQRTRSRDRIHEPGTGNCPRGSNAGTRGGGNGGGNGGGRGGGRGGGGRR